MTIGFGGGRWVLAGSGTAVEGKRPAAVGAGATGEVARFAAPEPCTVLAPARTVAAAAEAEVDADPALEAARLARIASVATAEAARAATAVADVNMDAETDADRFAALAPGAPGAPAGAGVV
jgi:hypothetical protein